MKMLAQEKPETIADIMARMRQTLAERVADQETQAKLSLKPRDLASYDTAALGRVIRPMLEKDGRGWRVLAAEIGVTSPDLSRIMAGQSVSAPKIYAICDWAGIPDRQFYKPPRKAKCFTGKPLKQKGGRA